MHAYAFCVYPIFQIISLPTGYFIYFLFLTYLLDTSILLGVVRLPNLMSGPSLTVEFSAYFLLFKCIYILFVL